MKGNPQLGFTSLEQEATHISLPSKGVIPKWLSGSLIRNGSAKFEVGTEQYRHWFDGLAMLYKFSFERGQVFFSNRMLASQAYKKTREKGRIVYSEFATAPNRSRLGRIFMSLTHQTDNASVNITKLGDRFIAMTETPHRVIFDPYSLKALGHLKYRDNLTGHLTTVHPHFDWDSGEVINYITRFSYTSTYNIYRIKPGTTKRTLICSLPVKEPAYMHSFGMSENYVILSEFPLVLNPVKLLLSGKPLIHHLNWKPERGTNFHIINKKNGRLVATLQSEAFFAFHHVNAFEKEGELFLDLAIYKDPSIIWTLYLAKLKQEDLVIPTPELRRYRIDLQLGRLDQQVLFRDPFEFPRINYRRCNTRDYSFTYGISAYQSNGFSNKLVKVNLSDQSSRYWFEKYCYPGEPVFVPAPDAEAEDDGVVLSVVLDTQKRVSFLLVLDACSFREMARARTPYAIPFGAHGQFFEEFFG